MDVGDLRRKCKQETNRPSAVSQYAPSDKASERDIASRVRARKVRCIDPSVLQSIRLYREASPIANPYILTNDEKSMDVNSVEDEGCGA